MPTVYVSKDAKNNLRQRITGDTYLSPLRLAESVVCWLNDHYAWNMARITNVLDPGAGKGVWGQAVLDKAAVAQYKPFLTGVELRRNKAPVGYDVGWYNRTDFLKWDSLDEYDLVIGNPPFKFAEEFIRHSLGMLRENGLICFLLPSDFSHSATRAEGLFREYRPAWEVSLAQRPQFRGPNGESLGSANPNNYQFLVWEFESAKQTLKDYFSWR